MRFAVSFTDSNGLCAVTGKPEAMDFLVPVPDGMDSFEGAMFALAEVTRVRGMSPRPLPDLVEVKAKLVDEVLHHPSLSRPLLAAVPDRTPS